MRRSRRRLLILLAMVPLTGDFGESLSWTSETITTTGYGNDSKWEHPLMIGFVVAVQFSGVFLILLVVPIFLIPLIEERFEGRLPRVLPPLADHVLVYTYGPAVATLMDELRHAKVPTVVLEEDEATARRSSDNGSTASSSRSPPESLIRLGEITRPIKRDGPLIVAGYGGVGRKVVQMLSDAGEKVCVIDLVAGERVDVVGDVLDQSALKDAGQLLAHHVIGEEAVSLQPAIKVVKVEPGSLVGNNPIDSRVRERTGCSIIAVARGDDIVVVFDASFVLAEGDAIYICGTQDAVAEYLEVFPRARS